MPGLKLCIELDLFHAYTSSVHQVQCSLVNRHEELSSLLATACCGSNLVDYPLPDACPPSHTIRACRCLRRSPLLLVCLPQPAPCLPAPPSLLFACRTRRQQLAKLQAAVSFGNFAGVADGSNRPAIVLPGTAQGYPVNPLTGSLGVPAVTADARASNNTPTTGSSGSSQAVASLSSMVGLAGGSNSSSAGRLGLMGSRGSGYGRGRLSGGVLGGPKSVSFQTASTASLPAGIIVGDGTGVVDNMAVIGGPPDGMMAGPDMATAAGIGMGLPGALNMPSAIVSLSKVCVGSIGRCFGSRCPLFCSSFGVMGGCFISTGVGLVMWVQPSNCSGAALRCCVFGHLLHCLLPVCNQLSECKCQVHVDTCLLTPIMSCIWALIYVQSVVAGLPSIGEEREESKDSHSHSKEASS